MKRILAVFCLTAIIVSGTIGACCQPRDYSFYIKVDSGVSFAENAHVNAPNPPWNPAIQGYNAKLGHCPIIGFSVGYEFSYLVDLELNVSNRSLFKYRKCQTPCTGGASYTRKFDLDITSVLMCANIIGRSTCLHWDVGCGKIYPIIGAGVGRSRLLITNYRTTGLPPTGDSTPFESFSAENQYTHRRNFTYTILAGFEYTRDDCWTIGTGYRFFNAGHFKGPRYQRVADGSAVDVACDAWKMRFRANEWFVEFKIFI